MAGRFLLDTNAVIALLADDRALIAKIDAAEAVFTSITVLGELYFGAANSGRVEKSLAVVDRFAQTCPILLCSRSTARTYGLIKAALKTKGRPLPENDIWIAAVARENSLTLVSRDGHFQEIDGLNLEGW